MAETNELKPGLSRRKLLKFAAIGGAIGSVAGIGGLAFNFENVKRHSEKETVADFSTPGADYRFLGGAHGSPEVDERLNFVSKLGPAQVPSDATFFTIETGLNQYLGPELFPIISKLYYLAPTRPVYAFASDVLQVLTDKKVPLVLTDVPTPIIDPTRWINLGVSVIGGLGVLGAFKDRNITRRRFLQAGVLSGMALNVARTTNQSLLDYLHNAASEEWAQKIAEANHFIELSQPESFDLTFRNAVNTVKTIDLENHFQVSPQTGRPKGVLIFGAGHWGFPEYFKSGKETVLNYLSLYPKEFIHTLFGEDNPHLYTSVIITPDNGSIKVEKVENPELKELFKK